MLFDDTKISISIPEGLYKTLSDEQLEIVSGNFEDVMDGIDFESIIKNKLLEAGLNWIDWQITVV